MSESITPYLNEARHTAKALAQALDALLQSPNCDLLDAQTKQIIQDIQPQLANLRAALACALRPLDLPRHAYVQLEGVQIPLPMQALADFCAKWHIAELALFGSVLRQDFRPESDIDVLIRYHDSTVRTLADFLAMQAELEALLGRAVEITEHEALNRSTNEWLRRSVLQSARVIYAA